MRKVDASSWSKKCLLVCWFTPSFCSCILVNAFCFAVCFSDVFAVCNLSLALTTNCKHYMQFHVECSFDWSQMIDHLWAGKCSLSFTVFRDKFITLTRQNSLGQKGEEWIWNLNCFRGHHSPSSLSPREGGQKAAWGISTCLWRQLERAMMELIWHQASSQSFPLSHLNSVKAPSSGSRSVILPDVILPLLPQSHTDLSGPSSYTNWWPFSMGITPKPTF